MGAVKTEIDGIQVLRFVAATMVVVHHATQATTNWLSFGAAGVDVFFVISGFIMAYTTGRSPQGADSAGRFILRRIARIVPLYWLAIIWTTRRTAPDLNLLRDFFFIPHYNEQIPSMITPIIVQGWTLNYEMMFYVIFGACLISSKRYVVLLAVLLLLPIVGGMLPGLYGKFYGNSIVYEFGFGVLLQLAVRRYGYPDWHRNTFLALLVLGFIGLIYGYDFEPRWFFQGAPAVLVVWSGIRALEGWNRVPLLGDASYAIYLFHWASFGAVKPLAPHLSITALNLVTIATGIVSGCIIHKLVEIRLTNVAKGLLFGASEKSRSVAARQSRRKRALAPSVLTAYDEHNTNTST